MEKKVERRIVKKTHHVTKSNDLNEMILVKLQEKGFTPVELKLFYTAVSLISKDDKDFNTYELNISEFADLTGTKHKNVQQQLHAAGQRLMQKVVTWKRDKRTITAALISSVETADDKDYVHITMAPAMQKELLMLSKNFTTYTLQNIASFKSTHSIRLYELLVQYKTIGKREFEIDELKDKLFIKRTAWGRVSDFKLRVVAKSVDEINGLTDLQVSFQQVKKQKKVFYDFNIRAKSLVDPAQESSADEGEKPKINLKPTELEALKMLAETVCNVTGCEAEKYLQEKIEQAQDSKKKISSPAAWIKTVMQADLKKAMKPARLHGVKKAKKTDFHLDESRGKDYTNAELEKILLGRKKAKKEAEKDG